METEPAPGGASIGAGVDPAEFAKQVGQTPEAQLAEGMQGELREPVLDEIFARMQEHFNPSQAAGAEAVVHWKILDRPGGGFDHYEVVVAADTCSVNKPPEREPQVVFSINPADFLRLVTGNILGPALVTSGRLMIEGDVMLATRVATMFRMPTAGPS